LQRVIGYTLLPNGLYRAIYEDLGPVPQSWQIGTGGPIVLPDSKILTADSNYYGKPPDKHGPRIGERGYKDLKRGLQRRL